MIFKTIIQGIGKLPKTGHKVKSIYSPNTCTSLGKNGELVAFFPRVLPSPIPICQYWQIMQIHWVQFNVDSKPARNLTGRIWKQKSYRKIEIINSPYIPTWLLKYLCKEPSSDWMSRQTCKFVILFKHSDTCTTQVAKSGSQTGFRCLI